MREYPVNSGGISRKIDRIATFRHAMLRVAPHRYATLEPLGKPGGSRAFIADGPPQAETVM